jgi:hypothetical protein
LYRANLENLNWGVEYLAREAQQEACQQEAEVREKRIVAIEKHGQDYKSFCAVAQGYFNQSNPVAISGCTK